MLAKSSKLDQFIFFKASNTHTETLKKLNGSFFQPHTTVVKLQCDENNYKTTTSLITVV